MSLTNAQILNGYTGLSKRIVKLLGTMPFHKSDIKQLLIDSEAWSETPAVKQEFNNNLTNTNLKTTASADVKRIGLALALLEIIEAG